jgi:hypothetical protein
MRPSQRVEIITEVSRQLGAMGWEYADFVLDQFGVRPDSETYGNSEDHVRRSLAGATPDALVEIAAHFGIAVEVPPAPEEGKLLWRPGDVRVFISHIVADKISATGLSRAMDEYAISSFVAHEDIHPSLEWQAEIERALRSMDAMIALVSPDFPKSKWTDQEVGFALGRGRLVIPIKLGVDPYGFFGKHQAIQGEGRKANSIAADVYAALVRNPLTQARMVGPAVRVFADSASYRDAEGNAERLLGFPSMSISDLKRVEEACLANRQIYEANRCPALIAELYRRHSYAPETIPGRWEEDDVTSA